MSDPQVHPLLNSLLDCWERNNAVLVNLLRSLPPGALQLKAAPGSPSVSEMFMHMHHERMVSVFENAPEFAGPVPEKEWASEDDPDRIAQALAESAHAVRRAVQGRVEADRNFDLDFNHPAALIQFLIFHEGYHHGQIKIALKLAGCPMSDKEAGPLTWAVWRRRK